MRSRPWRECDRLCSDPIVPQRRLMNRAKVNKHLVEPSSPSEEKMQRFNHRLSSRELEVLQLITEGHSNPEIAAALHLSPNTVKTHVRSII